MRINSKPDTRADSHTGNFFLWREQTREVDFDQDKGGGLELLEAKWT